MARFSGVNSAMRQLVHDLDSTRLASQNAYLEVANYLKVGYSGKTEGKWWCIGSVGLPWGGCRAFEYCRVYYGIRRPGWV